MKYIVAIIQPDRLDDVMERLEERSIHLVTVSNVLGRGRQKGISEVYRGHKEAGLLKKVKSASVGENSQNLIIHGDNLEALKALMPYYQGKIKCIYIDPPYNTGNESWV